ncbi:hypothetical protein [Sinorhizobium fredii]|uniref:hypothetical protein n=1 Tax=Rhizobium fredii TaxID=380 RepID=UPI0013EF29D7|nr:hypothetical protein [Sinorhizobium fredii]
MRDTDSGAKIVEISDGSLRIELAFNWFHSRVILGLVVAATFQLVVFRLRFRSSALECEFIEVVDELGDGVVVDLLDGHPAEEVQQHRETRFDLVLPCWRAVIVELPLGDAHVNVLRDDVGDQYVSDILIPNLQTVTCVLLGDVLRQFAFDTGLVVIGFFPEAEAELRLAVANEVLLLPLIEPPTRAFARPAHGYPSVLSLFPSFGQLGFRQFDGCHGALPLPVSLSCDDGDRLRPRRLPWSCFVLARQPVSDGRPCDHPLPILLHGRQPALLDRAV